MMDNDRPQPLRDAASQLTRVVGVLGSLVAALAGFGILTVAQQDAIVGLLGAIPGLVTLVTSVLVAFGIVRQAEPVVTPLADPRDAQMRPLIYGPSVSYRSDG
ncbi:MAG TPA: hypothetical protein VGX25_35420 [Actinophytocola sp.]|uniref:hypothetical protein n=1 Tax=Actinophytocola sp. TaxID=1872138 RepID=UPI002DDCF6ED|nr:hypothetical protein [Actinophytocola sp.]HEV2784705.1 hypothetical protein [Actinophytocola sp.]